MDTTETTIFRRILVEAAKREASDLHFTVGSRPMVRVDRNLAMLDEEEVCTQDIITGVVNSIFTPEQLEALHTNRDIVVTKVFFDRIRTKVHAFYQEDFLALSFRFLNLHAKTLKEFQVPAVIEKLASNMRGLLLVAGSYGSGRTTLATAMLEQINRTRIAHIMTIERPIEYNLVSNKSIVNQREVGKDVASFNEALERTQEEDVDVLFVSECSSPSVVRQVLELANSGIFVIAIVDTDAAVHAIEKIIASFEEHEQQYIRGLLADTLQGVIVQALLPKIGGGLAAVYEVLVNNASAKSLMVANRISQLSQLIVSSKSEGMMSMDTELATLVRSQNVSTDTARQYVKNKETFESLIKGVF